MKNFQQGILQELIERLRNHDIMGTGAQMAYYMLLLIFPLVIFVIAILGYLNLPVDDAVYFVSLITPTEAISFLDEFIQYIFTEKQTNLLLFSLFTTFWTASNALKILTKSLNKAYGVEESRSYIKRKLLSIPFTLLVTLCIATALVIPILGKSLLILLSNFFYISNILIEYLRYLRWLMAIFTVFSVLLVIYTISPNVKIRIADIIPGTALATISWISMSFFFSLYFSIFRGYAIVYGSIGAFVILMIWLLWSSMVILIGGELNAILQDRRYARRKNTHWKKPKVKENMDIT